MEDFVNACIDTPDERNIMYSDIVGAIQQIPSEYLIDDGDIQDQNKAWYPYGCVFFSDSQWSNIENFLEWSKVRSTGKELCDYAFSIGKFNPKSWAAIIDWPKVGTKLWYLDGYAIVSTLDEIKHSIANNRPVQCGANKIDWLSANESNDFTVSAWSGSAHSIILNGYSDSRKQVRIKQSYNRWDKGHQWLNYSDIDLLYPSRFSLIDKTDPLITNYKKTIMDNISIEEAKTAYTNGFWNWERPTETATRQEVAAMIQRAVSKK